MTKYDDINGEEKNLKHIKNGNFKFQLKPKKTTRDCENK